MKSVLNSDVDINFILSPTLKSDVLSLYISPYIEVKFQVILNFKCSILLEIQRENVNVFGLSLSFSHIIQLLEVYSMLDLIKDIPGDIRYFLCNIQDEQDQKPVDLSTEDSCRQITQRFVESFKAIHASNQYAELSVLAPSAGSPPLLSSVSPTEACIQPQNTMTITYSDPIGSVGPLNPMFGDTRSRATSDPRWAIQRQETKQKLQVEWHRRQSRCRPRRNGIVSLLNAPPTAKSLDPRLLSPSPRGNELELYRRMSTRVEDDENWDVVLPETSNPEIEVIEEIEENGSTENVQLLRPLESNVLSHNNDRRDCFSCFSFATDWIVDLFKTDK